MPLTGQISRPVPLLDRARRRRRRRARCGSGLLRRSIAARSSSALMRGCADAGEDRRGGRCARCAARPARRPGGRGGGDVVAAAQDRLGGRLLAVLELGQQALGLLGARLEHLHARDDLAVLVGDPLQELGALQQVGEAVGLEDHGERVGLVGLVELDQPVGQRDAAGLQLGAGARQAVARHLEVVAHRQQLVARAVQLGPGPCAAAAGCRGSRPGGRGCGCCSAGCPWSGRPPCASCLCDLGALLVDALGQRGALPREGAAARRPRRPAGGVARRASSSRRKSVRAHAFTRVMQGFSAPGTG